MADVSETYQKPEHVPDELFIPGDFWKQTTPDPHQKMRDITAGRDIVFLQEHFHKGHSPAGTWLACSAEAVRQIMLDTESFPSSGATIFGKILGDYVFFPVEIDPPQHHKYRAILLPFFNPKAIRAMEADIITVIDDLLDQILPKGECDFPSEFARILPARIFLSLMGMPQSRAEEFVDWARTAMDHNTEADDKVAAMRQIANYLAAEIEERKSRPKDGTLLSELALGEIDGRPLTINESIGGAMVLFLAGLDTVANLLGWIFYHLAKDTDLQAELRQNPKQLGPTLEELMRFYSPVTNSRRSAKDTEVCGVLIKEGDTVCVSQTLASRDDKEYKNPDVLDNNRPPSRHNVFGYGPHVCVGMHLARLEARLVLERWFARTSEFRLNGSVRKRGANVLSVEELPLAFK